MSISLIQIRQVSGVGKIWKRRDTYFLKIDELSPIEPEKLVGRECYLTVFALGQAIIVGQARIRYDVGPRSRAYLIYLPKRLNRVWERLKGLKKIKFMLEIESDEKSSK